MKTREAQLADALEEEYNSLPEFSEYGDFNRLHEYPEVILYLREGTLPTYPEDNELLQVVLEDFETIYSDYFN